MILGTQLVSLVGLRPLIPVLLFLTTSADRLKVFFVSMLMSYPDTPARPVHFQMLSFTIREMVTFFACCFISLSNRPSGEQEVIAL